MKKGYVYSILSAILFGSAGIIIKLAFKEGVDSIGLLTFQYIFAVSLMFCLAMVTNKSLLKINKRNLINTGVLGIVGNTFMTIFYYMAFNYLHVSIVTILLYTNPIIIFIYSLIFEKSHIDKGKFIALIFAFMGCFLSLGLYRSIGNVSIIGVILGLSSAIFYAFMNIYSEKKLSDLNSYAINFYSTMFSLILLLLIKFPYNFFRSGVSTNLIIYTVVLAIFCEIIPLTLLYASIKYIGSLKVSIIGNLEIPTAMIFSYIFLSETVALPQIIGAGMVIYAVYRIRK